MKLTAEQIAKIEALVGTSEDEGQRSAIIKHGVNDIKALSGFLSVLRTLGVVIIPRRAGRLGKQDRREFQAFLRAKRAAQGAAS